MIKETNYTIQKNINLKSEVLYIINMKEKNCKKYFFKKEIKTEKTGEYRQSLPERIPIIKNKNMVMLSLFQARKKEKTLSFVISEGNNEIY